jgi:Flp pilus assembly protein TadD
MPPAPRAGPAEEVLQLNNRGAAEMEQFHFTKAAGLFHKAFALDPDFLAGAVNEGIALYYDRKKEAAEKVLSQVIARDPKQIQARYVIALLDRAMARDAEALRHIQVVLEQDPADPAAQYLAGNLDAARHQWDAAIRHYRKALERAPLNVSVHYALATASAQKGDAAEAEKVMARYQELKQPGRGTNFGTQYLEEGRYSEVVRVAGPGEAPDLKGSPGRPYFVDVAAASGIVFLHGGPRDNPNFSVPPSWSRSTGGSKELIRLASAYGSGAAFLDFDGDGWPDLFLANASAEGSSPSALYRNNHDGTFRLVTASGVNFRGIAMGAASGDYDNDGRPDLFIAGYRGSALYHNEGKGKFREVTSFLTPQLGKSWALSAAFIDLDHDGDLDLFVTCAGGPARPGRNLLYRNNGNGTFTETGELSGMARSAFATSLAAMDYNDSRDVDILLVDAPPTLYSNNRDGSFADVTLKSGLKIPAGSLGIAAGDFDGTGRVDYCVPLRGAVRLFRNQDSTFHSQDIAVSSSHPFWSAQAFDYDNDGDLDILLVGDELHLLENTGRREFRDVTSSVGLDKIIATNARSVAIADYDQDGDLDVLVTRCGYAPLLLRNEGGNRNHSFRLTLNGKTDNRPGFGAKVEWAAGGLWQHREVFGELGYLSQSSVDILLGLGRHSVPDYVRVLWPSGVLQTEIPSRSSDRLRMAELDRKGTSCPILYAWNGHEYEFVTDFLGGSAMGYLEEPGRYSVPDTDEYVKINAGQLRPRGDRLSLKMVNQLEEVILFDMVRLLAVDHPSSVEIYPDERLLSCPPYPDFRVFTAFAPRNVVSATDETGRSWTDALRVEDRDYVRGFRFLPFKGYAEPHDLVLDLGDLRGSERVLLFLDGWIDYADSTSNYAATHAGLKLIPPYIQSWESGKWRTVLQDMGCPAGLPKTMTVDLTGKIPLTQQTRIRIVTNMRIYWDRIRVETAAQDSRLRITTLEPVEATAAWLGYPRQWSPDGLAPFYYDYAHRDAAAGWKTHKGQYTRLGDVRELLAGVDDRYVVLAHGEAITAEFSAAGLPPLPQGWTRDWLLYVDGFGKDMDLHSQYPDTVEPLPHHKDLPYRAQSWNLVSDAAWEAFRQLFLTRQLP